MEKFIFYQQLTFLTEPPSNTEFDAILKDFKKQEGYGALAAAMFLAKGSKKPLHVGRKYLNIISILVLKL